MHPGSSGTLIGPSSTQLYYKDWLDSLGVRIQLIRHGSYKSAGEPHFDWGIDGYDKPYLDVTVTEKKQNIKLS